MNKSKIGNGTDVISLCASSFTRRKPLAACVAAVFALSAPLALATTWPVSICDEFGSGSLRAAIASAASGDTIDMTGLSCSRISLTTGAIAVPQSSLTINGPGMNNLTVSGVDYYSYPIHHFDRTFKHTGTGGSLAIYDLSITNGHMYPTYGNAYGGCIYSAGSVALYNVQIYNCFASVATNTTARGGAIFANGSVTIKNSYLSHNVASGGFNGVSFGGGVAARGDFTAKYSTLSFNRAAAPNVSIGGAVYANGNVTLQGTIVTSNYAWHSAGIEAYSGLPSGITTTILNSTISGNSASYFTGGLYTNSGKVNLVNSTIAFNTAAKGHIGSKAPYTFAAPGVTTSDSYGPVSVNMQSTLIANNTYGHSTPVESDLSVPNPASTKVTFGGAGNLVRATNAAVPAGTMSSCPLLGPLRNNGGLTLTHALLSTSPALEMGNNTVGLNNDQRGPGFARISLPPPGGMAPTVPDIGAYEIQRNDIIFNAGFDGCP